MYCYNEIEAQARLAGGITMEMGKRKKSINKEILCNMCGKVIKFDHGILKEDVFQGHKEWGYFSNKDLEVHKFNICEDCYEKLIQTFKIPIQVEKKIEVM